MKAFNQKLNAWRSYSLGSLEESHTWLQQRYFELEKNILQQGVPFYYITLYLEYSLYDLMCHIRLGASSLSKFKSLMVSSANTLAHHILHHLHLIYKKRLSVSGCDHLVLHSQSNAKVNLSRGGQSLDKNSWLIHLD